MEAAGGEVNHAKVYAGGGLVWECNAQGIGKRLVDLRETVYVLRPHGRFRSDRAEAWFQTVIGQPYDFLGVILQFYAMQRGGSRRKQFCSEFAVRLLRHGGVRPVRDGYDADATAPETLNASGGFDLIWCDPRFARDV